MQADVNFVIKSFKHNGRLHRMWLENWRVPEAELLPAHQEQAMYVFVNSQTKIQESDGRQWISKIPGVSFFVPGEWFNAIGLIEERSVRFYCNIASPPYVVDRVLTYIDYDLDVIVSPANAVQVVDQEEFERHKAAYHYSREVQDKVAKGMERLMKRIEAGEPPFQRDAVLRYYQLWKDERVGE